MLLPQLHNVLNWKMSMKLSKTIAIFDSFHALLIILVGKLYVYAHKQRTRYTSYAIQRVMLDGFHYEVTSN